MVELIRKDLMSRENLNCSETMLHAADRAYNLQLPPEAFRLAAGFGGGMGVQKTCGAITGGIMAISSLFVGAKAKDDEYFKEINARFFQEVQEKMGSVDCDVLKEKYQDEATGCKPTVLMIAEILEKIIDQEMEAREIESLPHS